MAKSLDEIFNSQQPNQQLNQQPSSRKSLDDIFAGQQQMPSMEQPQTQQPQEQGFFDPLLESTGQVLTGAGKGLLSTFRGATSLGERGLQAITGRSQERPTSAERLIPKSAVTPKNLGERVGFGAEQLAEFALPVPGTKVKGAGLLTRALKEGVEFGAKTAAQEGELNKEVGASTLIGTGFPIAGKVTTELFKGVNRFLKPVTSAVRETGKSVLKATTSVPEKALSRAVADPKAVREGFNKAIDATTIGQDATKAYKVVKNAADKAFSSGKKELQNVKLTPLERAEVKTGLRELKDNFVNKAQDFGIRFDGDKIKSFPLKIDAPAQKNIQNALQRIKSHKDFSPQGLQSLAEDLQSLRKFTAADLKSKSTPLVGELINGVSSYIKNNKIQPIRQLGKLRTEYAKSKNILDNANAVLNATKKDDVKAIKSSVSKLTNLFKEDNDIYLDALQALEKSSGQQFLSKLAGTEFQRISPGVLRTSLAIGGTGTLASANPLALMLIPMFSPRAVGGTITNISQSRQLLEELFKIGLGKETLSASIRGLINRIITGNVDFEKEEDRKALEEIF